MAAVSMTVAENRVAGDERASLQPLSVGLDLTALLPEATGIDVYLLELVSALARLADDGGEDAAATRYHLFVNREDAERLPPLRDGFSVTRAATRNRASRLLWQQAALPALSAARGIEVIHSPSFILPLAARGPAHVLTIHDMTSFTHPETHIRLRRSLPYRRAMLASIRRASRVTVPSQAVARALLRELPDVAPDRVRVVPHGVSPRFRPYNADEIEAVRRELSLEGPYILFVGTIQPRKNLGTLLEAYRQLTRQGFRERLVIAGMHGWEEERFLREAGTGELRERVRLLGYVEDRLLPGLYAGARAFVFPSLEEGFGLPTVEAMACGVPVVASRIPALTENLDGAAALVEPRRSDRLAGTLAGLLNDPRAWREHRERGLARARDFRWDRAARSMLACYREAARSSPPSGRA